MKDNEIVRSVAHTLAKVHQLKVPIRKQSNWQLKQIGDMIQSAYANQPIDSLVDEMNLDELRNFDVRKEYKWLKEQVDALQYPLVFCHNDFLGSNVLVTEPEDKMLLIDLEYCTYGCRGYDLGVFLSQWGLEPNDYEKLDMPSDEVMERFIEYYIEGADRLEPGYGCKPENSVKAILHETKLFMSVFFLFWTAFFLNQREKMIDAIPFDIRANFVSTNHFKNHLILNFD